MNESYPQEFLEQMRALLGEETAPFFAALDEPHVTSLRLNTAREGAERAAEPFTEGIVPWCPEGRYLKAGVRPGLSPLHAAGAYYIQEASAMAPAMVLSPQPGERVLDLCAAPGGKSSQLALALQGKGVLVANEPEGARARALSGNLERLGVVNAVVTNALPEQLSARWEGFFDKVLVDAPCSGEGMFRRDPDARAQWNPASPAGCAARQANILDHAARMLRPGGRLVYSTCTFNRLENEQTIEAFLARHADFSPEEFSLPGIDASQGGCLRLFPHRLRGEGHFVACLRRQGEADVRRPAQSERTRPDKAVEGAMRLLTAQVLPAWPKRFDSLRPELSADCLWAVPIDCPPLQGIRVLRQGLRVLRLGRNYVEPDHALAMALKPSEAARVQALDDAQAEAFLRGEVLPCELSGWVLAVYCGMPLGWGKASGGQLKNHLPKGLRRSAGPTATCCRRGQTKLGAID